MPGTRRHIPPAQKELLVTMSAHLSVSDIARSTEISKRTIERVLKMWREEGCVERKSPLAGRRRALDSLDIAYLESLVEQTPDIYLSELRSALEIARNVIVSEQTISASLHRRGWTQKQATRLAAERDEERRNAFQYEIGEFRPDQLVFLDESAANRHTTRRRLAWAPCGDRARRHDCFVRGQRYSILPAISLDGILHLDILTRSWNSQQFRIYLEALLDVMNPFPLPNSVLIMDNASVHHFEGVQEMVEARGCRLVYLPPYSPDFNPIEEGFSSMKAWIRKNRDYVLGEMSGADVCDPFSMLFDAVYETMTPENIRGWYRDSGYVV